MKVLTILLALALVQSLEVIGNFTNFHFLNRSDSNCTTLTSVGKKNCTNSTFLEYNVFNAFYEPYLNAFVGDINIYGYKNYTPNYTLTAPMVMSVNKTFSTSIGQFNWTMVVDFTHINEGPFAHREIFMEGKGAYTRYGESAMGRVTFMYTVPWTYIDGNNVTWYGGFEYNGTNLTEAFY